MHARVGYGGQYSSSAWTPVRVTLRNRTTGDIRGSVEIPDSESGNNYGPQQRYRALYQSTVVLPAGATKRVTMYMPYGSINGQVTVRFRSGDTVLAHNTSWPLAFDGSSLVIGTLTDDIATTAWTRHLGSTSMLSVNLGSAQNLDPEPDALATFDTIVLSNLDASRLDRDQLDALAAYVHNGGSLILIGGSSAPSLLKPLPPSLLPGTPVGTTTVRDLRGLRALGASPPHGSDVVSILHAPQGTVLASQGHIPLAIRTRLGDGRVLYLAFDPNEGPIAHWSGRMSLLRRLVSMANPEAVARGATMQPNGGPSPLMVKLAAVGQGISTELANIPQAALPSILLFLILAIVYIVVLGPLNFLILRRLHRREMMWITVPLLGILCVGTTFGVAYRLKGNAVYVNAISVVQLDGNARARPISSYISLFAPVRGDYRLTYPGSGLSTTVPGPWFGGGGGRPIGYRFDEGSDGGVTLPAMSMWTMRDVAVDTTISIPGSVHSDLTVDSDGYLTGTVRNGTNLPLLHPVIFAGQHFERLADIPPGGVEAVRVKPANFIRNRFPTTPWYRAFGRPGPMGWYSSVPSVPFPVPFQGGPAVSYGTYGGIRSTAYFGGGGCCPQPVARQEKTLTDRIRNTAALIPGGPTLLSSSPVTLVAWNTAPLSRVQVDGSAPSRRDLNLLVTPLSVGMRPGPFTLRPGTLGAELMEANPQTPNQGCCPYNGTNSVIFGAGGDATFAWTVPGRHVRFSSLNLGVNAGGAAGARLGGLFDWHANAWVPINLRYATARLSHPNRFVSPTGQILLRLRASEASGDVRIADPLQSLQIWGKGVVT
jgi:uncharacterized membrane protein YhaH (DUF805 family)